MSQPLDLLGPDPVRRRRRVLLGFLALNVAGAGAAWCWKPALFARYLGRLCAGAPGFGWAIPWSHLVVFGTAFAIELAVLGWRRSSLARLASGDGSAHVDLGYWAVRLLGLHRLLPLIASLGGVAVVGAAGHFVFDKGLLLGTPWPVLACVTSVLVVDFLDYWYHRALHQVPALWELHKTHHSGREFTLVSGLRNHPLEQAGKTMVLAIPAKLMGVPLDAYLVARVALEVFDALQHSQLRWSYGWVGCWVLYAPAGHRIHHSLDPVHHDTNFGNLSPIWDRLFGTWYDGDVAVRELGIPENPYNRANFLDEALLAVELFLARLRGPAKPPEAA